MNHKLRLADVGRTNVTRSLRSGLLLVAVIAAQASSQTVLIDDFNDGVADGWTTEDATIGRSHGPGIFDASSGEYQFEGAGLVPLRDVGGGSTRYSIWNGSSAPIFSDGFVRATVRAETEGTDPSVLMRASGSPEAGFSGYLFFGTTVGNGFWFNKIVNGNLAQARQLPRNLLPSDYRFHAKEDWNIEAGVVGNQLSMKVWPAGDQEPESPQWTFNDRRPLTGGFGLEAAIDGVYRQPALVSATFDDVHFTFPPHEDPFALAPYDIYSWQPPMPVPQVEGPFFVEGSPEKPDMRDDVTTSDGWPGLRIQGQVTEFDGEPIPGLKLDFWQPDDQGSYDNSGGYDLRGHIFTDEEGNYELWTVMPANYEQIRTRHLHAKLGGENTGFESPTYTTQFYFSNPFDNDIDADGILDKVIEGGVRTEHDAIALANDFITAADVEAAGARFSELANNILTLNNDPLVDGYFDTTLNIMMPDMFQAPAPLRLPGDVDGDGSVALADFLILSDNFGMEVQQYTLGDLNGDGTVRFADFLLLSNSFGQTSRVASVPEPSTMVLLSLLGLLYAVARRRIAIGERSGSQHSQ